jgi:hypothetical protein
MVLVSALACAGIASAQSPALEIRESTDPARVADVEQRAADIQARQQAESQNMTSGSSGSNGSGGSSASGSSASGEGRKHGKRHSGRQSGDGSSHGAGHGSSTGKAGGSANK